MRTPNIPDGVFFGGVALAGLVVLIGGYFVLTNLNKVARGVTGGVIGGATEAAGGAIQGAADVVSGGLNVGARVVTGDNYDTLGTALWKWLNPEAAERERQIVSGVYVDSPGHGATGAW